MKTSPPKITYAISGRCGFIYRFNHSTQICEYLSYTDGKWVVDIYCPDLDMTSCTKGSSYYCRPINPKACRYFEKDGGYDPEGLKFERSEITQRSGGNSASLNVEPIDEIVY